MHFLQRNLGVDRARQCKVQQRENKVEQSNLQTSTPFVGSLKTALLEEVSACATLLRIISVLITGYGYKTIQSRFTYVSELTEVFMQV